MVRYGIVGFGAHAVKRLMPGFALAKNSTVVALSRRDQAKAREFGEKYGIRQVFASTEELCKSPEVDAVFVATPNSVHIDDVLTAVRHGKAVLCEKPMAVNAEEAKAMVEAAKSAGVVLGIAQCFRFEESVNRIRERVQRGDIGKVIFARSEFAFSTKGHHRVWLTDARISGGGPVPDVGVHCIDTLRYILGEDPVTVSAQMVHDADSGEVEASAVLQMKFRGDALGVVVVSNRTTYRTPLEIVGSEGVLRAQDALNVEWPITIELLRDGEVAESEQVSNGQTYARQVDEFSAAVEGRAAFAVPGEEGWKNQMVLDAAYRSAKAGSTEPTGL